MIRPIQGPLQGVVAERLRCAIVIASARSPRTASPGTSQSDHPSGRSARSARRRARGAALRPSSRQRVSRDLVVPLRSDDRRHELPRRAGVTSRRRDSEGLRWQPLRQRRTHNRFSPASRAGPQINGTSTRTGCSSRSFESHDPAFSANYGHRRSLIDTLTDTRTEPCFRVATADSAPPPSQKNIKA